MKKRRKRQIPINVVERQLVLNSEVINKYPRLKEILQKYKNVKQKDILNDDFDDELRNLILFVFKDIKMEAEKEWYGTGDMRVIDPPNIKDRVQCSLCGRRNKYIFYIKNRYNNIQLNVGSECILKFPGIDSRLPKGMTLRQVKGRAVRQYEKLKRLELFNQKFPDAKNMLSNWKTEYRNLPIIIPEYEHNIITNIHIKADKIFELYLDGKGSETDLNRFEELIFKRKELMIEIKMFKDKNKDKKFICTREIYDWILKEGTYKERLIKTIRENASLLTKESISYIYEDEFMNKTLIDFKKKLSNTKVSIERFEDNNIYLKFEDKIGRIECELYLSKEEFMKAYGIKLFESDDVICEKDIVLKSKLVVNEKNYNKVKEKLEEILKGSNFKVHLDDGQYSLEFIDIAKKVFTDQIDSHIFLNSQKYEILFKDKYSKENICKVIKSIKRWRPLSDKQKYDIGDISKRPESSGI